MKKNLTVMRVSFSIFVVAVVALILRTSQPVEAVTLPPPVDDGSSVRQVERAATDVGLGVGLGEDGATLPSGSSTQPTPNFPGISTPVWVTDPGEAVSVMNDTVLYGMSDIRGGLVSGSRANNNNADLPPDLFVDTLSRSADNTVGAPMSFSGIVRNVSPLAAAPTTTRLRLIGVGALTFDQTTATVAPNGEQAVVWTDLSTSLSEGRYEFEICADATNVVVEQDETNNCATQIFLLFPPSTTPMPDLVVDSITFSPSGYLGVEGDVLMGDTISYTATVRNIGDAPADQIPLWFIMGSRDPFPPFSGTPSSLPVPEPGLGADPGSLGSAGACSQSTILDLPGTGLEPGATTQHTISMVTPCGTFNDNEQYGSYEMTAAVNLPFISGINIPERNLNLESNTRSVNINVTGQPAQPTYLERILGSLGDTFDSLFNFSFLETASASHESTIPPPNFNATVQSDSEVRLSWDDLTDEDYYVIEQSTDSSFTTGVTTIAQTSFGANTTSVYLNTSTLLLPGGTYNWRVVSCYHDPVPESPSCVDGIRSTPSPIERRQVYRIPAPTISNIQTNEVTITAPTYTSTSGETFHMTFLRRTGTSGPLYNVSLLALDSLNTSYTTFTDRSVVEGATYTYYACIDVIFNCLSVESEPSVEVTIPTTPPPPAPTELRAPVVVRAAGVSPPRWPQAVSVSFLGWGSSVGLGYFEIQRRPHDPRNPQPFTTVGTTFRPPFIDTTFPNNDATYYDYRVITMPGDPGHSPSPPSREDFAYVYGRIFQSPVSIYDSLDVRGNTSDAVGNMSVNSGLTAGRDDLSSTHALTGNTLFTGTVEVGGGSLDVSGTGSPVTIGPAGDATASLQVNGNMRVFGNLGQFYSVSGSTLPLEDVIWDGPSTATCAAGDILISCTPRGAGVSSTEGIESYQRFDEVNQQCIVWGRGLVPGSVGIDEMRAEALCFNPDAS